jgi:hypothetical protein
MLFTLVVLLVFALLVTMAGFILSFKPRDDGETLYAAAPVRRRYPDTEPIRNPRYPRYEQPDRVPYPRSRRVVTTQVTQALPRSTRTMRALAMPTVVAWPRLGRWGTGEQAPPWYIVVIGLISVFVLAVFALNAVFPRNAILVPTWFASANAPLAQAVSQSAPQPTYAASKALHRISQLDPSQYNSTQDYNTWAYSACSTAAMTEVFDAYGRHYRIADVLKVEAALGEITPALGLVEDVGVQRTAAQFGFKTSWGYNLSLSQIIAIANSGEPVIVSWPPGKYPGGHLIVVTGGNSTTVFLADSSIYNRTSLSWAQFMQWWGGFSAVVTPE